MRCADFTFTHKDVSKHFLHAGPYSPQEIKFPDAWITPVLSTVLAMWWCGMIFRLGVSGVALGFLLSIHLCCFFACASLTLCLTPALSSNLEHQPHMRGWSYAFAVFELQYKVVGVSTLTYFSKEHVTWRQGVHILSHSTLLSTKKDSLKACSEDPSELCSGGRLDLTGSPLLFMWR